MKSRCRHILSVVAVLVFMSGTAQEGYAQKWRKNKKADKEVKAEKVTVEKVRPDMEKRSEFLPFFVEGTDTIYYDEITAAKYTPDSRSRRAANGDSITGWYIISVRHILMRS